MKSVQTDGARNPESPAGKSPAKKSSANVTQPIKPMKSHRGLLIMFSFLLALWIAMMCVMYVGVYQQRHPHQSPVSSIPLKPGAAH